MDTRNPGRATALTAVLVKEQTLTGQAATLALPGSLALVEKTLATLAWLARRRQQTSRAALRAVRVRFLMARFVRLALLESTPSPAGLVASTARAATRQLGRATALPAELGKARTLTGLAATLALPAHFLLEDLQRARRAPSARTVRRRRRAA